MGKGGGKQHTPYEKRDNLKSTQELSVIDVISEGPIEGPVNGLQGLRLNDTPVIDAKGGVNVHGVKAEWRAGEEEQTPLTDFDGSAAETLINAEVTHSRPITRTITSAVVDRLRVTVGVQALVRTTDKGDRLDDSVKMEIQIQRGGVWLTEKTIVINGKRTSPFMTAVLIDNLPSRPFNLRVVRVTSDSTTDTLQNKTVWQGLTEIINITQSYPNTALVGLKVDADQFGSQSVSRKFHLRGRIVRVPSNYDPIARTYNGLWDGTFIPAWTNNPAWQLLDLLTHPRYGLGQRIGLAEVDKWALYAIAQYCDQRVSDGVGGTEPRMTCNAYLADRRKAYEVISDFCSVMRCMPVWNGQRMTFTQDRPSDTVWTYTNANVVNGEFKYSYSAAKERYNVAEVRFVDPMNGWNVSVELVEDRVDIQKNGRQVVQIDAFGCTSRGQAHRTGLWVIQTALRETQIVAFSVGAEGLRHTPGDIIEVCDNDYAGVSIGGRLVAVDTATRTVTLDRDIELPETGQAVMRFIGQDGQPQSASITSQPSQHQVVLNPFPTGVMTGNVWGLKTATLRRRLFRCLAIKETEKGTYAITGLQHVPEKESIVDKGVTFDVEAMRATMHSQTPPEVQHLTAQIQPAALGWQVVASWDTPQLIKGGQFQVKLLTQDTPARLVSQALTTETTYTFDELTQGNYTLSVRSMNTQGRYGDVTQIAVSIQAPAAPVEVNVSSGYLSVTLTPRLPETTVTHTQFEFYFTGEYALGPFEDAQVHGTYLGAGQSWTTRDLQVGTVYYWYVRSVSVLGKSAWVEVAAACERGVSDLLNDFAGQITRSHLGHAVLAEIDTKAIKAEVDASLKGKADSRALNRKADAEAVNTLTKKVDSLNGKVTAQVTQVSSLLAQAGESSASVQRTQSAIADLQGKLQAQATLKVQTSRHGRPVITGITLNASPETGSSVIIKADTFALISDLRGLVTTPFVVKDGYAFLDNALIQTASIDTSKIRDASITSAKIGNVIQSSGYRSGVSGWIIRKNGNAEFNNGKFNGQITATSGRLNNVTISENCTIQGQLSAARIVGDIAKSYTLTGNSVFIPAQSVGMQLLAMVAVEVDNRGRYSGRLHFNNQPQSPRTQAVLSSYSTAYTTGGHNNESTNYRVTHLYALTYTLPVNTPVTVKWVPEKYFRGTQSVLIWMSKA